MLTPLLKKNIYLLNEKLRLLIIHVPNSGVESITRARTYMHITYSLLLFLSSTAAALQATVLRACETLRDCDKLMLNPFQIHLRFPFLFLTQTTSPLGQQYIPNAS